jgi:hypothetical protein
MLAETKAVLQTVLRAMRSESDFDLTYLKHLRA